MLLKVNKINLKTELALKFLKLIWLFGTTSPSLFFPNIRRVKIWPIMAWNPAAVYFYIIIPYILQPLGEEVLTPKIQSYFQFLNSSDDLKRREEREVVGKYYIYI